MFTTKTTQRKIYFISYIFFSIFLLITTFFGKSMAILDCFLIIACYISIWKSLQRIKKYDAMKTHLKFQGTRREIKERYFQKLKSRKAYYCYITAILCIWILFFLCCFAGWKMLNQFPSFCVAGIYFLFALELIFCSRYCILNRIVNFIFKTEFRGCGTCPVKGWDLLMLISPSLYVISELRFFGQSVVFISNLLAIICFCYWEYIKYFILSGSIQKQKIHTCSKNQSCIELRN